VTHVLFIDYPPQAFADAFAGFDTRLHFAKSADLETIRHVLPHVEVIALRSHPRLTADLLALAPNLQLVIRGGAGLEHIDDDYLRQHSIRLVSTPEGNRNAVGEHTLGVLLCLLNKIHIADRQLRALQWRRAENTGLEIGGKNIGIIGYGNTGTAFAQKLSGFGARVYAYDKYRRHYADRYAAEAEPDDLFRLADVLSLHVPLTPETHHMVNAQFLARFHRPIWLLNQSRGPVVHTPSLIDALRIGRVLGAGLDVFENEDFDTLTPDQRADLEALATMDNVVLTPHVAGVTHESADRIRLYVRDAVVDYLKTRSRL